MATPNDRPSKSWNYWVESSDGLSLSTSKSAGSGVSVGDLMVYVFCSKSAASTVSGNNNGYTKLFDHYGAYGLSISVWTKVATAGDLSGTMTWTGQSGYDDMGWVAFSIYNVHADDPVAGYSKGPEAGGDNLYTCPAVSTSAIDEILNCRILFGSTADVYGDDNTTVWVDLQVPADDSATGLGITVTQGGTFDPPTGTQVMDTTTAGGGTAGAVTATLVFAGANAYPEYSDAFAVQLGSPF